MSQNLPGFIRNEKDLERYEKFIANQQPIITEAPDEMKDFRNYLNRNIGKLVRAESVIGNRLESRMGILLEVGPDYIVIKTGRNSVTMAIELGSVKFITVVHDNMNMRRFN